MISLRDDGSLWHGYVPIARRHTVAQSTDRGASLCPPLHRPPRQWIPLRTAAADVRTSRGPSHGTPQALGRDPCAAIVLDARQPAGEDALSSESTLSQIWFECLRKPRCPPVLSPALHQPVRSIDRPLDRPDRRPSRAADRRLPAGRLRGGAGRAGRDWFAQHDPQTLHALAGRARLRRPAEPRESEGEGARRFRARLRKAAGWPRNPTTATRWRKSVSCWRSATWPWRRSLRPRSGGGSFGSRSTWWLGTPFCGPGCWPPPSGKD